MTDMRYVTWLATCRRCCWPLACSGISLQRGSREWSAHSSAMGFPHRYLVGKYGPSGPLALSRGSFRFGPDCVAKLFAALRKSLLAAMPLRAISGVSSRMRREDQFSISSLSLADLGGETIAGSHAV